MEMPNIIAVSQLGDKQDRAHRVWAQSRETKNKKIFVVEGVGSSFVIFDGTQQINSFKTLTKCKEYLKELSI
jgi:hypothetical protein